ncbi:MAG: hypothetical protein WCO25_06290 [Candidatus Uhrbacteria bacterium]
MKALTKPPTRASLFWDTDPKKIDFKKNARYVIERVLDFGNDREIKWLVHHYEPATIKKVLREPRVAIHPRALGLWQKVFR